MESGPFSQFTGAVCARIRFQPDRAIIAEELTAHLEDRAEVLMAHGFDEETAQARAVAAMGDPAEIGKELDREHSPFWGWAHIWTDILRYIALFLTGLILFLLIIDFGPGEIFYKGEQTQDGFVDETILLTVPLWEWHATEHFFICFTKAEVFQYSGNSPHINRGPHVRLFYYQWHRNPFLRTEQYAYCRAIWDENGTSLTDRLLEDLRPEILCYEFESPGGSAFTVEVPLDWESVE